ncbi:glycosyltransferase [uncultured Azonexus sp.]|uniref:glycosyltransferase n=1 Tax=uncultured Azonexus sp. TaxID=520307 RepID=UPI0026382D20|nr:glycosyltransferase [uncultured Azonexus sp.]
MIFITVGTQLPFDRLIKVLDVWAGENASTGVFGQIGPSKLIPKNFESAAFLSPSEIAEKFSNADLIIAHAGMGTVLSAMKLRKPILIFPRRADLGEHRNDHQMATARWLESRLGLTVAFDEEALLDRLQSWKSIGPGPVIPDYASADFVDRLRGAIASF